MASGVGRFCGVLYKLATKLAPSSRKLLSLGRLPDTLTVGPLREPVTVVGNEAGPTPGRRVASDSMFLSRTGRLSSRCVSIVEPTVLLWVSTPITVAVTVTF